jgi:TldD protein
MGQTRGFEMFDQVSAEISLAMPPAGAHQAGSTSGAERSLPVVIKHGSGGVLFHEACGHGLEADLVAKGASVYRGKTGELVASPLVTLVDDGTMSTEWGAIGIDDEGHPSQYNVLIQDGVLTDYMWDHLRARKEGRLQSGNGRRQSYMHLPMVRMTNTYVLNGTEEPDDIVRATDHGVFVAQLGGGSVNTATGDFVFGMTEAYLIEGGEITEPLREGNLIGQRPAGAARHRPARQRLAMGNAGTCRQGRPGVPVRDGQPTPVSDDIGGTAAADVDEQGGPWNRASTRTLQHERRQQGRR